MKGRAQTILEAADADLDWEPDPEDPDDSLKLPEGFVITARLGMKAAFWAAGRWERRLQDAIIYPSAKCAFATLSAEKRNNCTAMGYFSIRLARVVSFVEAITLLKGEVNEAVEDLDWEPDPEDPDDSLELLKKMRRPGFIIESGMKSRHGARLLYWDQSRFFWTRSVGSATIYATRGEALNRLRGLKHGAEQTFARSARVVPLANYQVEAVQEAAGADDLDWEPDPSDPDDSLELMKKMGRPGFVIKRKGFKRMRPSYWADDGKLGDLGRWIDFRNLTDLGRWVDLPEATVYDQPCDAEARSCTLNQAQALLFGRLENLAYVVALADLPEAVQEAAGDDEDLDWEPDPEDPDQADPKAELARYDTKHERDTWIEQNLKEQDYRSRYRDPEEPDYWTVPYTCCGDYVGSFVEKSNAKALKKTYPWLETISAGYSTEWLALTMEVARTVPPDEWQSFTDEIERLERYPVVDEDLLSNMEWEAQTEAWDDWGRKDLKKELLEQTDNAFEKFVYRRMPDASWNDLRYQLEQNGNIDWVSEQGASMYFDVDRAAQRVDFATMIIGDQDRPAFDAAVRAVWNDWLGTFFEKLLRTHFARDNDVLHELDRLSDSETFRMFTKFLPPEEWEVDDEAVVSVDKDQVRQLVRELRSSDFLQSKPWRRVSPGQRYLPGVGTPDDVVDSLLNLAQNPLVEAEDLDWEPEADDPDDFPPAIKGTLPRREEVRFSYMVNKYGLIDYQHYGHSVDEEENAEIIAWIGDELGAGNTWAWCRVTVWANWTDEAEQVFGGIANDYGLSFENEAEFNESEVYARLQDQAFEDLLQQVRKKKGIKESKPVVQPVVEAGDDLDDLDWEPDPEDPDDASEHAMRHGHESSEIVYEDDKIKIVRPLNAWTFNHYAEEAAIRPIDPEDPVVWSDALDFFVVQKVRASPPDSPRRISARTDLLTFHYLAGVPNEGNSKAIQELVRQPLSQWLAKRARDENNEMAGRDMCALAYVADYDTFRPFLSQLNTENAGHIFNRENAWRIFGGLLATGRIEEAKEVAQHGGIDLRDVVLKKDGFWVLWKDWDELLFCFDKRSQKAAKELFDGDAYHWFDTTHTTFNDAWHWVDDEILDAIRGLLIGMPYTDEETHEEVAHTEESVAQLGDVDIKEILEENDLDGIMDAVRRAAWNAEESALVDAYTKGYCDEIEMALDADRHEWVDSQEKTKQGHIIDKLGFFFKLGVLRDWLDKHNEDQGFAFEGSTIHDLIENAIDPRTPNEQYSGDFDRDEFNDRVREELPRTMHWQREHPDPNQLQLPLQLPPAEPPEPV